ncbi:hypothetical protein [Acaryochloris sp. CCMEE 5410]|uniref:hypothetical protein n=1 Tax=Acaryochloris sp. CCMEE 5410 TaxID=310037 RepID=UPI00024844F1|nr:hypothetical protein [Acaryochloris sp. CCMEE 5410]KAI9129571.1 hypothetical protein ON05_033230 [Acaryochloris sp. CCMEE 5410]
METPIIALKPKRVPPVPKQQSESTSPAPKLIDKTEFPTKTPRGTWPPKRERGQGELSGKQRSVRRTTRLVEPDYSPQPKSLEALQTRKPRIPRVSAEMERRFRALELSQKNLLQQVKKQGELEHLTVFKSSAGQFWITVEGSGQPFIRIPFESPEYCYEAALELEDTFNVLQVIEVRPGETIERIEEMIGVWLERERVKRVWG